MKNLIPNQRTMIAEMQELQAWVKTQGLTMTKDNIQALRVLRANPTTMNSRRPIV